MRTVFDAATEQDMQRNSMTRWCVRQIGRIVAGVAIAGAFRCGQADEVPQASDAAGNATAYASRPLSLSDLELILRNMQYIIRKPPKPIDERREHSDAFARGIQAERLGLCRHEIAIPALLAVARDDSDDYAARVRAVSGLARIPDVHVVDHLIDLLSDEVPGIARAAYEELEGLTRRRAYPSGIVLDSDPNSAMRQEFAAGWRAWWDENREQYVPSFPPPHPVQVSWQELLRQRDEADAETEAARKFREKVHADADAADQCP